MPLCTPHSSGEEVLAALSVGAFHTLISDIGMPVMDGFEVIQRVRARPLEQGRLPTIVLTAFARSEDRRRALVLLDG